MFLAESIMSTVCLWSCWAAEWRRCAFTLSLSIKTERTNKTKKKYILKDTLVCRRTKGERRLIKIHSPLWMCVMTRLNSSVLGYFSFLSTFAFYHCNQCWFNTSDLMWHFIPVFLFFFFFFCLYYWGEKSPILKGLIQMRSYLRKRGVRLFRMYETLLITRLPPHCESHPSTWLYSYGFVFYLFFFFFAINS